MTGFQVISALVFLVALVAAYLPQIKQYLVKLRPAVGIPPAPPAPAVNKQMVSDMVTVAELRDRLIKLGCKEGADACTALLRVMVEFKYPQG